MSDAQADCLAIAQERLGPTATVELLDLEDGGRVVVLGPPGLVAEGEALRETSKRLMALAGIKRVTIAL